jgi:uncharacterized protein (DUF169 family)
MDYSAAAATLTRALNLDAPPVALTFVDAAPAGLPGPSAISPSSCGFWRQAEGGTFFAPADAHLNCPIGAMVMGFELSEESTAQVMAAAEMMIGCGYLGADEVAGIPRMAPAARGIVYGPLGEAKQPVDVVLLWLSPREAMRYAEAAGSCAWTASSPGGLLGRPARAAVPSATRGGAAVLSLGCAGMRTFTELSHDRLLGVVPGGRLGDFLSALVRTVEANAQMQRYYDGRKAEVASTSRGSVLARVGMSDNGADGLENRSRGRAHL